MSDSSKPQRDEAEPSEGVCSDAREVRSLRRAWSVFTRYPSPRALGLLVTVSLGVRVRLLALHGLASLTWWDLLIPVLVFGVIWPFQEWFLHQHVLHMKPRDIAGRRFDPLFARKHRAHHRKPWLIDDIVLPLNVVLPLVPVLVLASVKLAPTIDLALTVITTYGAAALHYEWIHYLTHTNVAPKSGWFRRVRRNHRYHHYKNERYWQGFTVPLVDTLLGTAPDPREVETSPTARTLGVDEDADI